MLHHHLDISDLWEGPEFAVGYQREGDQNFLKIIGKELGFRYHPCYPVLIDGRRVSSTRIRQALDAGDLAQVMTCLGRLFSFEGEVLKEWSDPYQLGKISVTIRIPFSQALPQCGEYLGRIQSDERDPPTRVRFAQMTDGIRQGWLAYVTITEGCQNLIHRSIRVELLDITPSDTALFLIAAIASHSSFHR